MYDSATSLKRGPGASATLYGNPPVLKSWPAGLRELHGAPIHQKAYDNKVVVLFFWASFFPPSVQKLAAFQTIYGEYHSQGLEMLGVSLDEPRQQDAVLRWLHTFDITSPQVYDGLMWQTPLARLYGIHSAPTALVIGRDGIVHYVSEGSVDSGLTQAIEQALATAQSSSSRLGFGRSLTG
jgi:peroxiredoxin